MALFNISGSGDWGVTEIGENLCQNFDKDNPRKNKRQIKHKTKSRSSTNHQKNVKKKSKIPDGVKILSGKNGLLRKIKKTLKGQKFHMEDTTPLHSSFAEDENNVSVVKNNVNKNGLKRKHILTPDGREKSKKIKKEVKQNIGKNMSKQLKKKKIDRETTKPSHNEKQSEHNSKKNRLSRKFKLLKEESDRETPHKVTKIDPTHLKKRKQQLEKLHQLLSENEQNNGLPSKKETPVLTLRQKMMRKLKAARFRFLNEQIYSTTSKETEKIFRQDPEAFKAYHEGYKLQVKRWPLNPLDKIIKSLNKINKASVIADFGCGEARLAKSVEQEVHSFDLVAANETVTACDMAHVPLQDASVDVAVFCLSLMGTNLKDYLLEANRVLKMGGLLKIAEIESRFEDINVFIKDSEQFGFKKTWMDLSNNLFYFIDFKKVSSIKDKKKLPLITLQPCLYKKR